MLKKLLGLLAVIGTIFGAMAGAKKSKELKELEGKIDESKKESFNTRYASWLFSFGFYNR